MTEIIAQNIDWQRAARICPRTAFSYVIEAPAYGQDCALVVRAPTVDQARRLREQIKVEVEVTGQPVKQFPRESLDEITKAAQAMGLGVAQRRGFDYSETCYVALSSQRQTHIPLAASEYCGSQDIINAARALTVVRGRGHGLFVQYDAGCSVVHAAHEIRHSAAAMPVLVAGALIARTDRWGDAVTVPGVRSRMVMILQPEVLRHYVVFPSGRQAKIEDIPLVVSRDNVTMIEPPRCRFGGCAL